MKRGASNIVRAVFKREFLSYFTSPTGYVFLTLFVFLSAVAAFWQERFFQNNLANLDQLNAWFPYLLVFLIPSIAMGLWAEERKQGTEELLLSLPASHGALIFGKYLAALGIYTVALIFSLSHVVVLTWLGSPDPGLMASTYLGYWLMGAALLPLGMLASQLTDNLTVSFILGSVFCAVPVFLRHAGAILSGSWQRAAEHLSVTEQFRELAGGVVTPGALTYFAALAGAILYTNIWLVGRRRWPARPGSPKLGRHYLARSAALLVAAGAVTMIAARSGSRVDVTSEQIHSLSAQTVNLIRAIDPKRPVMIQAYLSPDVPRSYLPVRSNLVTFLREYSALGRERVETRIIETVKYSREAREARERYGIQPFRVPVTEESASTVNEIFLGLVFTCGSEEFVIPFFDRGLPVEYELTRSLRVVSRAERKKVGVLETGARLFGGFDFESKRQTQDWSIVGELRKQYEVVRVPADADYPADLSALVAAHPSSLSTPQIARLAAYIKSGKPALVLLDPMTAFNLSLSPFLAAQGPAPGIFGQQPPAAPPPGDIRPLLETLGVDWMAARVVWDKYNPHPQLQNLPPEIVFVGRGSLAADKTVKSPFDEHDAISSGLQEVVLMYPGEIKPRSDSRAKFTPLLTTGRNSGVVRFDQLVERTVFGVSMIQGVARTPDADLHTLAARIEGGGIKAVVAADADLIGEEFFELRRRGVENLNLDNVTFVLNAIDDLAGERAYIALRKRRPKHRTLEAVEARTRVYEEKRAQKAQEVAALAEKRLAEAQARLNAAVAAIRMRPDLDEQAREIMISNVQKAENRRLEVARANIEDERQREIEDARAEMESSIRGIQNTIKLAAVSLPPVPAFLMFLLVSARKLRRERMRLAPGRLIARPVGASPPPRGGESSEGEAA
jgi:ABC-2 type transport system permease protein